jgi:hypothetical protein
MTMPVVMDAVRRAAAAPRYAYPWPDLPTAHDGSLWLVGYGSLMNSHSARRTLADGSFRGPVIAYGVRRLFDYVMPEAVRRRYPDPVGPREYGVLNVRATGRPEDSINGVLTEVALRDLPALRDREPGYDLVPVACTPHPATDSPPRIAYILACPPGSPQTDSSLLPHPGYLAVCLGGARDVSEEFATLFLESSYLADETTSLRDWLSEDNMDRKICERDRKPN